MLVAFGTGIFYIVPLVACWKIFSWTKVVTTGVILFWLSFFPLIQGFIAQYMVNPHNYSPLEVSPGEYVFTHDVDVRVPNLMIVMALSSLVFGLVGAALVEIDLNDNSEMPTVNTSLLSEGSAPRRDLTFMEGIVLKETYYMFLIFFMATFSGLFLWFTFKTYGSTVGNHSDYTLTMIGTFGSLGNSFARLFWP